MTDEITEAKKIIERVLELTSGPETISFTEAWIKACNLLDSEENLVVRH